MSNELALFLLPYEVLELIIKFLTNRDKTNFALVSYLARNLVWSSLFSDLLIHSDYEMPTLQHLRGAGKDVKENISKLRICTGDCIFYSAKRSLLFLALQDLPNLKSLTYIQRGQLIPARQLHELFSVIHYAPLTEFVLKTGYLPGDDVPLFNGLPGLRKLSIRWGVGDYSYPGNSLDQLHKLIEPSLATLVSLKIKDVSQSKTGAGGLDLSRLKAGGKTLREFEYHHRGTDDGILKAIPELFPFLTRLFIKWPNPPPEWKDTHIETLCKLKNLTELSLSLDLELASSDPAPNISLSATKAWVLRSHDRRRRVTEDIAKALPHLQRCSWVQLGVPMYVKRFCGLARGSIFEPRYVPVRPKPQIEHLFIVLEDGAVRSGIRRKWLKPVMPEDLPHTLELNNLLEYDS